MANGAKESAVRRAQGKKAARGENHSGATATGSSGKCGNPGEMRLYTEDSPGFQNGPSAVLVISLTFMAFVVVLHIVGKLRGCVKLIDFIGCIGICCLDPAKLL